MPILTKQEAELFAKVLASASDLGQSTVRICTRHEGWTTHLHYEGHTDAGLFDQVHIMRKHFRVDEEWREEMFHRKVDFLRAYGLA